jgi:hypothetical protein
VPEKKLKLPFKIIKIKKVRVKDHFMNAYEKISGRILFHKYKLKN